MKTIRMLFFGGIGDLLALIGYLLAGVILVLVLIQNGTYFLSLWFNNQWRV